MSLYTEYVTEALVNLNSKKGLSRQQIKKYIYYKYLQENPGNDEIINQTIVKGTKDNIFIQPKGPSGPIHLVKTNNYNMLKRKRIE